MIMKEKSGLFAFFISAVLLTGMVLAAWFVPLGRNWLVVLGIMMISFLWLGHYVTGRPLGILVNERNVMSLSRFQMVIWTLLILSAYLSMVMYRIRTDVPDALAVPMDWHLWALMGISAASLVGSPLLLSNKTSKKAHPTAVRKAAKETGEDENDVEDNRQGLLYVNPDLESASFKDLFQGDEIKNTSRIDLPKLQMFFFTVVIAIGYSMDLFAKLSGPVIIEQFPPFSEGVLALLGISHAGYLSAKGIDHTEQAPEADGNPPGGPRGGKPVAAATDGDTIKKA